ncbi:hypothetical protein CWI37_0346p0030 [Hamiltosporidium tvaerminnensis]|uniref:Uncharacterized protein n=2 Tax=Hamiltosporidium TaxID=1176354 RepID=A0A4Q9LEP8_9MICR|nr:hypothetical protein CWI37_0346p0030 [Hamiltosporidium tvaerminnensis]TBU06479.1 hypothetical protein CWI36_0443p0050 [Hamiltosporidium magnivora]
MLRKFFFTSISFYLIYRFYKYQFNKLLNDENYLSDLYVKKKSSSENEVIKTTLNEAKRLASSGDKNLASEYYMYAYQVLNCDWSQILEEINPNDTELLNVLTKKKNEYA